MPKLNVNSASREELVEAGVRADLVEEILKLRRKGRIESVEVLDAVPGVGPVTLEQLRKTLDFSDKTPSGGNGDAKATQEAGTSTKETTETAANVAKEATDNVAQLGKQATEQAAAVTREAASQAENVVRGGLQFVRRTADATAEVERETVRRAASGTTELSQVFVDLLNEQTRQNIQALTALNEAVDWQRIFQIQSELMTANLERMGELTKRYVEVTQALATSVMAVANNQGKKAA